MSDVVIRLDVLRSALQQINRIAWALSHHLAVPDVRFSLDEALAVSALITRELAVR